MESNDLILHSIPIQLVELEDGVLMRHGLLQMHVNGEGLKPFFDLFLLLTQGEGIIRSELAQLMLPRFPGISSEGFNQIVDRLLAARLLQVGPATNDKVPSSLGTFLWNYQSDGRNQFADAQVVLLGVNEITRRLLTALLASGIRNIEVVDEPMLRNSRYFHSDGELDVEAWDNTTPICFERWEQEGGGQRASLIIAACDFGSQHELRCWNRYALQYGVPFLPILLTDHVGQIGPMVIAGAGPCLECLRARQNSNVSDPVMFRAAEHGACSAQNSIGYHPSMASVLGDIAAVEVAKHLMGKNTRTSIGTLIEVDLMTPALINHKVLKIPRCQICGTTDRISSARLSKSFPLPESAS
jgi:bacteriocin biosynthesis cyclodehydratase domain-containing protein